MRARLLFLIALLLPGFAAAQAPLDFPQSGALAVIGHVATGAVAVPAPVGTKPGAAPAIGGSLVKGQMGRWDFQVFNNTPSTLSISVELVEYAEGPRRTTSRAFSYNIRPGQSKAESVIGRADTVGCALMLARWKRLK